MSQMSYFCNQYHLFRYPLASQDRPGFRAAQLGAIHAVAGHFTQRDDPAIVTMPTGSGKTGVMIASAFVLRATRVLIVTPSRLVREQIVEEIRSLSLLRRLTALPDDIQPPNVSSIGERIVTVQRWRTLLPSDVVVGTVQSISPALEDVATPDPDEFDLVMVDEAHHSSARTWRALLDCFPNSRQILFTATPFRRDRRDIHGRFVFTYGVQQAREDGVFGRIRYRAVERRGDQRAHDIAVAIATRDQFQEDRAAGLDHLVMVRTDRKRRAHELAALYAEHTALRLAPLDSDHSLRHAKTVIRRLRAGSLDGIITVNMLGEGVDLPRLKIAAVHAPHKSLAATLQFIGRFARTAGENLGAATFLAVPDDIEIERQRLFEVGAAWQQIVENLNAAQIQRETNVREVIENFDSHGTLAPDLRDLSLYALEPYHHVKIYETTGAVDLRSDLEFPDGTTVAYGSVNHGGNAAVWITRERATVRWSRDDRIVDVRHGLFVVYYDRDTRLLFICASARSEGMYERIARQLVEDEHRVLSLPRINRALNGLENLEFFNVGMRNRVRGNQTESYRIITGPSAGQAILPSDARLFHRGHCYGRGEAEDGAITIGLSSASKVWSNRSSRIPELIEWCMELSRRIQVDRIPLTGSGLDYLSAGEEIDRLPPNIFRADWDYDIYRTPRLATVHANGVETRIPLTDLEIEIEHDICTDTRLALVFRNGEAAYHATFSFDTERLFEPADSDGTDIHVTAGNGTTALINFLNECPLCFYTEDLSLLRGFDLHKAPVEQVVPFAREQIEVVQWLDDAVDVLLEIGLTQDGRRSIHDYMGARLVARPACFVYYDHGSGEVADFVAVEEDERGATVSLVHCKSARGEAPGDRVRDLYDVCGQVVKSVVYADPRGLLQKLEGRYQRQARAACLKKGDFDTLRRVVDSHTRAAFRFEMVVVQPGISRDGLSPKAGHLLSAVNDYIVRGGFSSLCVLGS